VAHRVAAGVEHQRALTNHRPLSLRGEHRSESRPVRWLLAMLLAYLARVVKPHVERRHDAQRIEAE
jgi:hypothetical protein